MVYVVGQPVLFLFPGQESRIVLLSENAIVEIVDVMITGVRVISLAHALCEAPCGV